MVRMKTWWMGARPRTLPAAIAPVLMGTAMAYGNGVHHFLAAGVALVCAVLIQVGTNFVNDYSDFKKGADTAERVGPVRVMQAGLVTRGQMKGAIVLVFGMTLLISVYLVIRGGWVVVLIGILSIISGIGYTAGPVPYGYMGLGDIFVLIFFGPVAVAGTYYVQALVVDWVVILSGFAPGFISVAILTVNNLRDIEGDSRSGKKTLAVRFGPVFAMVEYFYSFVMAALIPVVIVVITGKYRWIIGAALILFFIPGALRVVFTVFNKNDGPSLNGVLGITGKLLLLYSLLFSVGWVLSARSWV